MHVQAKETSSEQLVPEIDKMIEGASQAVQYFKAMHSASEAIVKVVKSQLDYAEEQLKELQLEKERKYDQSPN